MKSSILLVAFHYESRGTRSSLNSFKVGNTGQIKQARYQDIAVFVFTCKVRIVVLILSN